MQQREVAEHDARDSGGAACLARECDPDRRGDGPVDARETAIRMDRDLLPPSTASATRTSRDDPNTSRSCGHVARHTASTSAARSSGARMAASSAAMAPRRSCGTAEARPTASGAGGVRSTDAARDACSHAPSHRLSASPLPTDTASTAIVAPLRFRGSPGPRSAMISTSGRSSSAAASRLSSDDPARPPAPRRRRAQDRRAATGTRGSVRAEPGAADDLSHQRPPPGVRELFRGRSCVGARDTIVRGPLAMRWGSSSGSRGMSDSPIAAAALVQRAGRLVFGRQVGGRSVRVVVRRRAELDARRTEPARQLAGQRLAVRKIQVHGSRRPGSGAEGGGEGLVGDPPEHEALLGTRRRRRSRPARADPPRSAASVRTCQAAEWSGWRRHPAAPAGGRP